MPITQQRLLNLLAAAQDYQSAVFDACHIARRERDLALAGQQSAEAALSNIALFLGEPEGLLRNAAGSATAIALERSHFTTSRVKDNERERARVARRRAAQQANQPTREE